MIRLSQGASFLEVEIKLSLFAWALHTNKVYKLPWEVCYPRFISQQIYHSCTLNHGSNCANISQELRKRGSPASTRGHRSKNYGTSSAKNQRSNHIHKLLVVNAWALRGLNAEHELNSAKNSKLRYHNFIKRAQLINHKRSNMSLGEELLFCILLIFLMSSSHMSSQHIYMGGGALAPTAVGRLRSAAATSPTPSSRHMSYPTPVIFTSMINMMLMLMLMLMLISIILGTIRHYLKLFHVLSFSLVWLPKIVKTWDRWSNPTEA